MLINNNHINIVYGWNLKDNLTLSCVSMLVKINLISFSLSYKLKCVKYIIKNKKTNYHNN